MSRTLRELIDLLESIEKQDVSEDSIVYDDGSNPSLTKKRRAAKEVAALQEDDDADDIRD